MEQQTCPSCGAPLAPGARFCENCGTRAGSPVLSQEPLAEPVTYTSASPRPAAVPLPRQDAVAPKTLPEKKPASGLIIAGVLALAVIAAIAFFVLPYFSTTGQDSPAAAAAVPTTSVIYTLTPVPQTSAMTATPAPGATVPPGALALGTFASFGSGKATGQGTVYRYWINDTYTWLDPQDNHYYVMEPDKGDKYIFVFADVVNTGTERIWAPGRNAIHLFYDGTEYYQDKNHWLPDDGLTREPQSIPVKEVMRVSQLSGSEYAEDYGYSHGQQVSAIYPGGSNAIDGYMVYEVPASLTPEKTWVRIDFIGGSPAYWKLA